MDVTIKISQTYTETELQAIGLKHYKSLYNHEIYKSDDGKVFWFEKKEKGLLKAIQFKKE